MKELSENFNLNNVYSAEFFLDSINLIYHFKVRKESAQSMFALVKEGSSILDSLNVGDVFPMKYYSDDTSNPAQKLDTQIKYIIKDNNGRFKGHYMVGLEIFSVN